MHALLERIPTLAMLAFIVALALIVAAGPGTRLGFWDFRFGLTLVRWCVYAGLAAAALGLLGFGASFMTDVGRWSSLIILLLAGGLSLHLVQTASAGRSLPPIHDITTDTDNPPTFDKIVALRADALNSLDYEGTTAPVAYGSSETALVSDLQKKAYPDIVPLHLDKTKEEAMNLAMDLIKSRGWDMVNADPDRGLIEATDETFWFGFKDDVAIRITENPEGGVIVDVRSVSRVGLSDLGVNAKRVRGLLADLEAAAG
ncbi:MAG: DUF1499 domain-containing protein [Alphaproteobacteria bacterium]|nr:MAG: DUF1499 domain-containing protein [Alphaproteobacteria bacterium]